MGENLIPVEIPCEIRDTSDRPPFFDNLKWFTAREAVMYLRLPSEGALRNLVYRRKIPYAKLGRLLRFEKRALDRFLESSTTHRRISL
jgi:excisionase family DNA binding protein